MGQNNERMEWQMAVRKKTKKEVRMISCEKNKIEKKSLKNYSFWFSFPSEKGREIVTSPIFVFVSVENINFDVDYLDISWIVFVLKVRESQKQIILFSKKETICLILNEKRGQCYL